MASKYSVFYPLIIGADNPILRKKSALIKDFSQEILDFSKILLELMYEYDGVGLAAPQLGENIRMVAVTHREEKKSNSNKKEKRKLIGKYIMINPQIIEYSKTTQLNEEACLSLPGMYGNVKRNTWIKVKYFDKNGVEKIEKLHGFNAVIVQHEIDHLDGILFIDKVVGEVEFDE